MDDGEFTRIKELGQAFGARMKAEAGIGDGVLQYEAGIFALAANTKAAGARGDIILVAGRGDQREAIRPAAQEYNYQDRI